MTLEVNNYSLVMTKNGWSPDEMETALCLGFVTEGNKVVADLRMTSKQALFDWLNYAFFQFMKLDQYKARRNVLFSDIKIVYKLIRENFMSVYYSKLGYKKPLREHQVEGISLMVFRKSNLLAYEPGLGKTLTSASLSKMLGIQRTIVITPTLIKWNWYRDMCEEWGYNPLYWTILDANKSKTMKAFRERFVVCNYEIVTKHFAHLTKEPVQHIILDECHYIKNTQTGTRYKPIERLIKYFPNARISFLSGTPVTNRVNDLFAYLKLAGHPLGENRSAFMKRYAISTVTRGREKVTGAKNLDELKLRIANFMIRKKAEECLDLPDLILRNYFFPMDDYKEEYDAVLAEMYNAKQGYEEADEQGKREKTMAIRANIHTLNRLTAMSKVPHVIKLIDNLWEQGRKCIVFSSYTKPLELLEEHYKRKCVRIDGSVSSHDRDRLIQIFKNDERVHLFLGNVKAAGVGVNLVNANDVIFMNFPFTPDDLEQPYKRAHRIGQKNTVNVYFTICEDSIDEQIQSIVIDKSRDINLLVDGEGKAGVVNYSQIPTLLFNSLIEKYEKDHGIVSKKERFISIA